ncbi:two-component system activity regulator YycH [Bacillaceae bacterium]
MKEKIKTSVLNVLVATSMILSWLLWTNQPQFETVDPPRYLEPQPLGETRELKRVLLPKSIVFHYGENRHTKALPGMAHYRFVIREMENWYFYNFKRTSLSREEWTNILEEYRGVEVIFPDALPIPVLAERFAMEGAFDPSAEKIDRVWLYLDDRDDVLYALFLSGESDEAVRARTSVTFHDLLNVYLSLGDKLPEYFPQPYDAEGTSFKPVYYLPKERQTVKEWRAFYETITVEQVVQALFVDPSLTRKIIERDNTLIITDGNRSIQITPDRTMLTYHEPVLETDEEGEIGNQLVSAVSFVNKHGGWTGDYLLSRVIGGGSPSQAGFVFREYLASYPVYGEGGQSLGMMSVQLDDTFVTGYQRSLIRLHKYVDDGNTQVMSGKEILHALREEGQDPGKVKDIYLGYQGSVTKEYVHLHPVWIVERANGTTQIVDARVSQGQGN